LLARTGFSQLLRTFIAADFDYSITDFDLDGGGVERAIAGGAGLFTHVRLL
jgi:hypothetical protein